ncbi:hypothetical protein [Porphyromonas canoris]|nr:hypothetical protein [Porphyromonas canoris]
MYQKIVGKAVKDYRKSGGGLSEKWRRIIGEVAEDYQGSSKGLLAK